MSEQIIDVKIDNIPAKVRVTNLEYYQRNKNDWSSDIDFYGGFDFNFEILDRKGYKAKWLEGKLDNINIRHNVEDQIVECLAIEDEPERMRMC